MKTIKLGTFNVRNHYNNMFYKGIDEKGNDYVKTLAHFVLENNIDILGTQELVSGYIKALETTLPYYKLVGDYRQKKEKKFARANETNSIMTNHKILFTDTDWLPYKPKKLFERIRHFFHIIPRIVTMAIIEIPEFGKVCMFNTHLEYRNSKIQFRQLRKLIEIMDEYIGKYPIILTGDFNASTKNTNFLDFMDALSKRGINVVPNELSTHTTKNDHPIDYIFLSNDFEVINMQIGDDKLDQISDHKIVLVEIKKK